MDAAIKHFEKTDKTMYFIAKNFGNLKPLKSKKTNNYFSDLCRIIIGQQLSGKAAEAIFNKFKEGGVVTTENILAYKDEEIRAMGLAWAKVKSIKELARIVFSGELNLKKLKRMTNAEVTNELIKIKGIGPWSAQMFLMFTLGREDIFSPGDYGLKKAISKHYKIKDPTPEQIEKISKKWSPYRTYASLYLWKSLE